MKRSLHKIFSILPIALFSLTLGFNKNVTDSLSLSAYKSTLVLKAEGDGTDGSAIDTRNITFDSDLGIIKGLLENHNYRLIPEGATVGQEYDESLRQQANANGEISLLDTEGDLVETDGATPEGERSSLYGITFTGLFLENSENPSGTKANFVVNIGGSSYEETKYKFPTKEQCINAVIGNGEDTGALNDLQLAREQIVKDMNGVGSVDLTEEQKSYYDNTLISISDLKKEDLTPFEVKQKANTLVEFFVEQSNFLTAKFRALRYIQNLNNGIGDPVISTSIADSYQQVSEMTNSAAIPDTIEDIDEVIKKLDEVVAVRKVVNTRKQSLDVFLADNVYPRSKPVELRSKADVIRDQYFEKIDKAQTAEEANKLYDEFIVEINNLIIDSSWGKYCYIHWIYIVGLAFYAAYFFVRGVLLKRQKLDGLNIFMIMLFTIGSIVFTIFSGCDLCTIMIIAGWAFLALTLSYYATYTIIGRRDPVVRTFTDEDLEREHIARRSENKVETVSKKSKKKNKKQLQAN